MPDEVASVKPVSHRWREIEDLPDDLEALRDKELEALCGAWVQRKALIGNPDSIAAFNARIAREWSIETGIIEGIYTLDRGITHTLIERGIDSAYIPHGATNLDPELVARTVQAHAEVLEGLFAFVRSERALSAGYIKELHAALLRYQNVALVFDQFERPFETELLKGAYKKLPNNPRRPDGSIHEFCPPEHVASEMDRMISLHEQHEARGVFSYVEAAWLHHAFTQIHPFQDGNGRVARALTSLVLIKDGLYPLVVTRDDREKYIEALEAADNGDLHHLIAMFARIEKRALTGAIGLAADVKPVSSVEEALAATRDMLIDLGRVVRAEYLVAKEIAGILQAATHARLLSFTEQFTRDITRVNSEFQASFGQTLAGDDLRTVAAGFRYDPNTIVYDVAFRLMLQGAGGQSTVTISFHGAGPAFSGLLMAAAWFKGAKGPELVPLSEDVFRISYNEPRAQAEQRYGKWLDDTLIRALAEWRRSLI
jgi:Fic family protein